MQSLLEDLLVSVIKKLLSQDVIKGAEESLIVWLAALVAEKDPSLLPLVEILAGALSVPYVAPKIAS